MGQYLSAPSTEKASLAALWRRRAGTAAHKCQSSSLQQHFRALGQACPAARHAAAGPSKVGQRRCRQ